MRASPARNRTISCAAPSSAARCSGGSESDSPDADGGVELVAAAGGVEAPDAPLAGGDDSLPVQATSKAASHEASSEA